ncbi:hypothetical protein ACIQ1J_23310 [Streptomyces sp. NPDC097107]|uniref:hypothetical protein n=1 Tax=Streptomyces sp. NPDC097107 TaxID=3366089 RepID=UPI00380BF693
MLPVLLQPDAGHLADVRTLHLLDGLLGQHLSRGSQGGDPLLVRGRPTLRHGGAEEPTVHGVGADQVHGSVPRGDPGVPDGPRVGDGRSATESRRLPESSSSASRTARS